MQNSLKAHKEESSQVSFFSSEGKRKKERKEQKNLFREYEVVLYGNAKIRSESADVHGAERNDKFY